MDSIYNGNFKKKYNSSYTGPDKKIQTNLINHTCQAEGTPSSSSIDFCNSYIKVIKTDEI